MDNPARYVASFNKQSKEAKYLAAFAYAALEGSTFWHEKLRAKNILHFGDKVRGLCIFMIIIANRYPNTSVGMHGPWKIRSIHKSSTLEEQCPRRGIPQCVSASLRYRTADGSCNNPRHLWWGAAMSTMSRYKFNTTVTLFFSFSFTFYFIAYL